MQRSNSLVKSSSMPNLKQLVDLDDLEPMSAKRAKFSPDLVRQLTAPNSPGCPEVSRATVRA